MDEDGNRDGGIVPAAQATDIEELRRRADQIEFSKQGVIKSSAILEVPFACECSGIEMGINRNPLPDQVTGLWVARGDARDCVICGTVCSAEEVQYFSQFSSGSWNEDSM